MLFLLLNYVWLISFWFSLKILKQNLYSFHMGYLEYFQSFNNLFLEMKQYTRVCILKVYNNLSSCAFVHLSMILSHKYWDRSSTICPSMFICRVSCPWLQQKVEIRIKNYTFWQLNTCNCSERWLVLWISSHSFTHKSVIRAASGFQRDYDANIIALNKETIAATWIGGGVRRGAWRRRVQKREKHGGVAQAPGTVGWRVMHGGGISALMRSPELCTTLRVQIS